MNKGGRLVKRDGVFAVVLAVTTLSACRDKGSQNSTPPPMMTVDYPAKGVAVQLDPFATGSNVALAVAAGSGDFLFGAFRVIPGVHWEWKTTLPSQVEVQLDKGGWAKKSYVQGDPLPIPPFRLRYRADLGDAARRGYPVVGGEVLGDAGAVMPSAFLFVLPRSADSPLQVTLQNGGKPLAGVAAAFSCGEGCFSLPGYWQAMESPLSFYRSESVSWSVGSLDEFPWQISLASELVANRSSVKEGVEVARENLRGAWKLLSERWGIPAPGNGFRIHLLVEPGCSFQGLEHDAATLLSIGYCEGEGFVSRLTRLAVHESIHVWNGKLVFPAATATWPLFAFDVSRLPLLYYYEGFTEGYARLLLSEHLPALRDVVRAKWEGSFSALAGQALGKGLETLSQTNPMLAYEAGAVLALRVAAALRTQFGVEEGRRRFWKIHRDLTEHGGFSIDKSLWEQRCFAAGVFSPCSGQAGGYGRDDLYAAFETALGTSAWGDLRAAHFDAAFVADALALEVLVKSVADASERVGASGLLLGTAGPGESWPL